MHAQPLTVIATVSGNAVPGVGVIPPIATVHVKPGQQATIPAYVWNRGTRNANISSIRALKYSRFWYSLDLYLPVVDIHASEMWVPVWPNDSRRVRFRDYPKFAGLIVWSIVKRGLKFVPILNNLRPTSREVEQVKDKVRWHYMHVHALLGWILIPIGLAAVTGIVK